MRNLKKDYFNYLKLFLKIRSNNDLDGYTLAELIVGSVVSLLVLVAGYQLTIMILNINMSDEKLLKMYSKNDNAMDFIIDEIQSSKRITIDNNSLPKNCLKAPGEFIFGLFLPPQAIDLSSYKNSVGGNKNKWQEVDCPIIYSMIKDSKSSSANKSTFQLIRKGPSVNEKGFYDTTRNSISVVRDQILDYDPKDKMICSKDSIAKNYKGLRLCVDKRGRGAQIAIYSAKDNDPNEYNYSYKTSGGFSHIQDGELIGSSSTIGGQGSACRDASDCNIFGTPIQSNKITFFMDVSGSMACPGKPRLSWCKNAKYIQGMNRIEAAKKQLIKGISSLKTCTKDSDPNCVKFNVVMFSSGSQYLYRQGPKPLTAARKTYALSWISKFGAYGYTRPWSGLNQAMQSQDVGQIILISDGIVWPDTGKCFWNSRNMKYTDCYTKYNRDYRSKTGTGSVLIDTISIGKNFCNDNGKWLGDLASGNGGNCKLIK